MRKLYFKTGILAMIFSTSFIIANTIEPTKKRFAETRDISDWVELPGNDFILHNGKNQRVRYFDKPNDPAIIVALNQDGNNLPYIDDWYSSMNFEDYSNVIQNIADHWGEPGVSYCKFTHDRYPGYIFMGYLSDFVNQTGSNQAKTGVGCGDYWNEIQYVNIQGEDPKDMGVIDLLGYELHQLGSKGKIFNWKGTVKELNNTHDTNNDNVLSPNEVIIAINAMIINTGYEIDGLFDSPGTRLGTGDYFGPVEYVDALDMTTAIATEEYKNNNEVYFSLKNKTTGKRIHGAWRGKIKVNLTSTAGIEEIKTVESKQIFYLNPVEDKIIIKIAGEVISDKNIKGIYNMFGQKVTSQTSNIRNLSTGIYIIHFITNEDEINKIKIIKK